MRSGERYILQLINEGFFKIDESGRIWKMQKLSRTGRRIPIKPKIADRKNKDGYLQVSVGRNVFALSHRIVWMHFYGDIPSGFEINHIDGKKFNNSPNNIEILTPSENMQHARDVLGFKPISGERHPKTKITHKVSDEILLRYSNGESGRRIARDLGIAHINIYKVINGTHWTQRQTQEPK